MMLRTLLIATIAATGATAAQAAERSFAVPAFDRVAVSGSPDVVVATGQAISVRASGDDAALDRLEIKVENGALQIRTKGKGWSWGTSSKTRVFVTVPMLRGADVTGSGNMLVDRIDVPEFSASGPGATMLRALPERRVASSAAALEVSLNWVMPRFLSRRLRPRHIARYRGGINRPSVAGSRVREFII